jgi:hypothetical protein
MFITLFRRETSPAPPSNFAGALPPPPQVPFESVAYDTRSRRGIAPPIPPIPGCPGRAVAQNVPCVTGLRRRSHSCVTARNTPRNARRVASAPRRTPASTRPPRSQKQTQDAQTWTRTRTPSTRTPTDADTLAQNIHLPHQPHPFVHSSTGLL